MRIIKIFLLATLLLMSCNKKSSHIDKFYNIENEVMQAEHDFMEMAAEKGITTAFITFCDDNAVINRNDSLIIGKKAISDFYQNKKYKNVTLSWKPDFVEVSNSNDMAYTYGKYTYTVIDSTGHTKEYKGVFHTVWKKQLDGKWKYVWD